MGSENCCSRCGGRLDGFNPFFCSTCRQAPTITIPVAEYRDLQRRAKFYKAVRWGVVLLALEEDAAYQTHDDGYQVLMELADDLRAAIKEQEG